jgi:hypothetical protein
MTGREDEPMDDREGGRHPDRQALHRHAEGGLEEDGAARRRPGRSWRGTSA